MNRYREVNVSDDGATVRYLTDRRSLRGVPVMANFPLLLIREAWDRGANFEDLADGFGAGLGTMGDWSGIRDSSKEAKDRMLERALNHLLP